MGKLIDADALVEAIHETALAGKNMLDEAWTWGLTKAATLAIEQPEAVVRCGECKHWYSDADTGMACEFTNMGQPPYGYCNWGERREP